VYRRHPYLNSRALRRVFGTRPSKSPSPHRDLARSRRHKSRMAGVGIRGCFQTNKNHNYRRTIQEGNDHPHRQCEARERRMPKRFAAARTDWSYNARVEAKATEATKYESGWELQQPMTRFGPAFGRVTERPTTGRCRKNGLFGRRLAGGGNGNSARRQHQLLRSVHPRDTLATVLAGTTLRHNPNCARTRDRWFARTTKEPAQQSTSHNYAGDRR